MNQTKMNDFFNSLNYAIEKTDSGTFWPGGGGQIGSPFVAIDALALHNQLLELKKNKSASELTNFFYNPSVIRYVVVGNFIIGLKVLIRDKKISLESAKESLEFFLDILDSKMDSDPFCVTGKNNWFSQKKVNILVQNLTFNSADEKEQTLISRMVIALNSLVWSFYYDIYVEAGFEFHGPYNIEFNGKKYSLLIRDYHDLKPIDLWENAKKISNQSVKLYLLYSRVDIKLDYFMHELSDEPLRKNLAFYAIELTDSEGKKSFVQVNDCIEIIEEVEKTTFEQVNFVNKLDTIEKIKKGAMICFYQLKSFREKIGIDWKPSKEVFEAIDTKGLEKWEKFKARANAISTGTANIDWSAKYDLNKPL